MTKNNEVIAEKPFQNSGVTRRLWRFQHAAVLERSIEVGFSLILSIYKVVYISIKDLHAGYAATRWRNLLSNLPKPNYITPFKTAKMPPVTPVNAWPS